MRLINIFVSIVILLGTISCSSNYNDSVQYDIVISKEKDFVQIIIIEMYALGEANQLKLNASLLDKYNIVYYKVINSEDNMKIGGINVSYRITILRSRTLLDVKHPENELRELIIK